MKTTPAGYNSQSRSSQTLQNICEQKTATKGRAVLEGVGLLIETVDACFSSYPLDEEGAVQAGRTGWSGGQDCQPPTWEVLISAMEYAKIAQQHIEVLRKELCT